MEAILPLLPNDDDEMPIPIPEENITRSLSPDIVPFVRDEQLPEGAVQSVRSTRGSRQSRNSEFRPIIPIGFAVRRSPTPTPTAEYDENIDDIDEDEYGDNLEHFQLPSETRTRREQEKGREGGRKTNKVTRKRLKKKSKKA